MVEQEGVLQQVKFRLTCVLIHLDQVDEDFTPADYRLQYRRSTSGGSQYEDAYIGRDCEFLVLHLDAHADYLFRVCARGEGRTEWSPWSVPQTGYTTLAAHGGRSFITAHLCLDNTALFHLARWLPTGGVSGAMFFSSSRSRDKNARPLAIMLRK